MKLLLVVLFIVGCYPDPPYKLRPEGSAIWVGRVESAVNIWNDGLEPYCGDAFPDGVFLPPSDDGEFRARAVHPDDWRMPDAVGFISPLGIDVKVSDDNMLRYPTHGIPTLLHEMGHLLGLDDTEEVGTVMHWKSSGLAKLGARDARDAAEALGCI